MSSLNSLKCFPILTILFLVKAFIARRKGGFRSADVCLFVCLFVAVSFEFPLNFTMVMGSFTQKHVLIQTDQSESRDCVWARSD